MYVSTYSFLVCIILIFLVEYPDCRFDVHISFLRECKILEIADEVNIMNYT